MEALKQTFEGLRFLVMCTATLIYLVIRDIYIAILPHALQRKKDVAGQRVLVTGAGGGLGRELALRFARRGARLILIDINDKANEETRRICKDVTDEAVCYNCDLTKADEVEKCISKIETDTGPIDICVNNAGATGKAALVWECEERDVRKVFEVNVLSHFWMHKAVMPRMLKRKHGHIVSIVSGTAICGLAGMGEYCASKAAALSLMESFWMEVYVLGLSKYIKLTTVLPDFMDTPMFDREILEGLKKRTLCSKPLNPAETADGIMSAILTEQKLYLIPRLFNGLAVFKAILSVESSTFLIKATGHIDGGMVSALKHSKTKFD